MTMRLEMDDWRLLQAYVRDGSEAAFSELVGHHIHWVHSVALRELGNPSLAEEVVQSVFVLLARKAPDLRPGTLVGGWLFRTTRHVAAHAARTEWRRKAREGKALAMTDNAAPSANSDEVWRQLAPHLDEAVGSLGENYRSAILLRYYEQMPLRQVAEALGVSEDAAKKRVNRGIAKIRAFLNRRGVTLAEATLSAALAGLPIHNVSAALTQNVIAASIAASAPGTAATLPVIAEQMLRVWHWGRLKNAAMWVVGTLAVVLISVTTAKRLQTNGLANLTSTKPENAVNSTLAKPAATARSLPTGNATQNEVNNPGMVVGFVLDQFDRPIAGAKVWGGFTSRPYASDTTDNLGRFSLGELRGPYFITVTADGFAADQAELDPAMIPRPLTFHLTATPPLRIRAVDESGQGMEGARVFLAEWWGRSGTLGQYLDKRTGFDGRMEWLSPPKGEFVIELGRDGYRYSRTNKLFASEKEHVIVMRPVVTVSGSITDADTGGFVRSFKITTGHSQPWAIWNETPMWDSPSAQETNGIYQVTIMEEQKAYLRVEAEGYQAVETHVMIAPQETEVIRDFELKRLGPESFIRGVVLLPDGKPAQGVEVALCTPDAGVNLRGTSFEPGVPGNLPRSQQHGYRVKTDSSGRFSFEPKPGAHTVFAVSPDGIGKARCFDAARPLEIRLQSWGRIEGFARLAPGTMPARVARWQPPGMLTSWMTLFYASETGPLDGNGRFVIKNVMPGFGRVSISSGPGQAPVLSEVVDISPGEVVHVQVGGMGRAVRGRLVAPPGVEIRSWTNQVSTAQVKAQWSSYRMPANLTGNEAERWRLESEDTDAGRQWFREQYSYEFKVREDGSFELPEVLPGNYILFIGVAQAALGSGPHFMARRPGSPRVASASLKFTVPAYGEVTTTRDVLDLGEIKLLNF